MGAVAWEDTGDRLEEMAGPLEKIPLCGNNFAAHGDNIMIIQLLGFRDHALWREGRGAPGVERAINT